MKRIDLDVMLVRETDAAVLVEYEGNTYWLPKSQIDLNEEDGTVTLPEWLAMEKEMI